MSTLTLDTLVRILARSTAGIANEKRPAGEQQFVDLGVTSLELLNIMIEVASEQDIDLSRLEEGALQPRTVNDLLVLLQGAQQ